MNKLPEKLFLSLSDYDYSLPENSIAQQPVSPRDASKLLKWDSEGIENSTFNNIAQYIPNGALLISNNTKVIPARMQFAKSTGARIEVFLLNPAENVPIEQALLNRTGAGKWCCMIGNLKRWKDTDTLIASIDGVEIKAKLVSRKSRIVNLLWPEGMSLAKVLEGFGKIPLPPYIKRNTVDEDASNYQTIFAKIDGAVAAPTAGLHFTNKVLDTLVEKSIKSVDFTLHVGAGTFKPVTCQNVFDHPMHAEVIIVEKKSLEQLLEHTFRIAVGTTSLRTLETLYWIGVKLHGKMPNPFNIEQGLVYSVKSDLTFEASIKQVISYLESEELTSFQAVTSIMITPFYKIKSIHALITNFHLPKSTLLMLIASLLGDSWKTIYDYALKNEYRFLSYGDSSLLFAKK